jgi:hypothetical protein
VEPRKAAKIVRSPIFAEAARREREEGNNRIFHLKERMSQPSGVA